VVAAIHHAAGVRLSTLPATPERVWEAIRALPPSPEAPRG
jgi:CO/xanthine dehydrogenase Mo-binding subunit